MAITTQAGILAALPGDRLYTIRAGITGKPWLSTWYNGTYPKAGGTPTARGSGGDVPTSATLGALPLRNAGAGNQLYLYKFIMSIQGNGGSVCLWVADRLFECSGFAGNITTAQAITSPAALTRPNANGVGTELWIEMNSVWGGTATTVTVTYTNSANVGSRTATCLIGTNQALNQGNMFPFSLQVGDLGVKSIQSVSLTPSTGTAGDATILLIRRVGFAMVGSGQRPNPSDPFMSMLSKVDNDACLFFFTSNNGTSVTNGIISGELQLIEG